MSGIKSFITSMPKTVRIRESARERLGGEAKKEIVYDGVSYILVGANLKQVPDHVANSWAGSDGDIEIMYDLDQST